jgi:hypothetical protein
MSRTILQDAKTVLEEGRPSSRHRYCDGNSESGPYSLEYFVVRWGQLELVLAPNGTVSLVRSKELVSRDPFGDLHSSPALYVLIYLSIGRCSRNTPEACQLAERLREMRAQFRQASAGAQG